MVAQTGLSYATLNAFAILFSPDQRASNSSSYAFYEEYFPGLTRTKDTWKQSVRHNFCTTKYFVKISDGLYRLTSDPAYVAKFKKSVEKRCTSVNLETTRRDMPDAKMLDMMVDRFMQWADGQSSFTSCGILTPPTEDDLSIRCRKRKEEAPEQAKRKHPRQNSNESSAIPCGTQGPQSVYVTPQSRRQQSSPNANYAPAFPYIDPRYKLVNSAPLANLAQPVFPQSVHPVSPLQSAYFESTAAEYFNGYGVPATFYANSDCEFSPSAEYKGGLEAIRDDVPQENCSVYVKSEELDGENS